MSKYIDLSVKTDIQVDAIKQSTLKIGSESVAIIPTSETDSTLQYGSGSWKYTNHGVSKELSKTLLPSTNRISFTGADLVNGKLTIKHNLGFKYILGLDYTVMPKNITFVDENTLELDYSDQPNTITGSVWFVMSDQTMLVQLAKSVKQGLIANWPLNESYNQNVASDDLGTYPLTSNRSNELELYGGRSGIIGSGWTRGADSKGAMSADTTISADVYKNAYTFNIWVLFPSGYNNRGVQMIGINRNKYYSEDRKCIGLYSDSGGGVRFVPVYWSHGNVTEEASLYTTYNLDKWCMITGTYSNKEAKLYKDGVLVNQRIFNDISNTTGFFTLFGETWGHRCGVRLDLASFWNRALSDEEISFLYHDGRGFDPYSGISGDTINLNFPSSDLIVSLPLDTRIAYGGEGGWSLSEAFSGNTFGFQNGIPCIYKTDSYGAFKLTPADRLPTGETPFTVSYWAKSSTEGNPMGSAETLNITFGESDAYNTFRMGLSATGVAVQNLNNSTAHANIYYDIDGTTWHHVLFRYTETAGELWVDGVKCGETTERYTIKPEQCMIFGRHYYNHGVGFTGAMSSLRIYGRALSESEIQALAKEFTPTT